MRPELNAGPAALPRNGVLALTGYGLRVAVERGHLIVADGVGQDRREGRFSRVAHGIERLVVLGHSGAITFEALRWLHELDIAFIQIGRDGELIATGTPRQLRDVRVLRGQAYALHSASGLAIARDLLTRKVQGQARVLDHIQGQRGAREAVNEALDQMAEADTLDRLRFVESRAAAAYWGAWEHLPIRFAGRDAKRVPAHWRTFGTRSSPLTSSPRKAATPANAILNYLYAILEAEARLAALAVGCDPALGVIHTDSRSRDSLACDLMEPARPKVDAEVLKLLDSQTFARSDFFEARDGNCRLMPEIARPLAASALQWAKVVAPIAERVGGAFLAASRDVPRGSTGATAPTAPTRFRTPLTGANHSRSKHARAATRPTSNALPNRCRECGTDLKARKHVYCDVCLADVARKASAKGVRVQAQLRAVGQDGRRSDRAREAHRAHHRAQLAAERAWEAEHDSVPNGRRFLRDIAPLVTIIPSRVLADATGLTVPYCSKVRRGAAIPHPRHWDGLKRAAEAHRRKHPGELDHRYDPAFFAQEIEPYLLALTAPAIQRATGLTLSYSRRLRYGHHVPDARHWGALYQLVGRIRAHPEVE